MRRVRKRKSTYTALLKGLYFAHRKSIEFADQINRRIVEQILQNERSVKPYMSLSDYQIFIELVKGFKLGHLRNKFGSVGCLASGRHLKLHDHVFLKTGNLV